MKKNKVLDKGLDQAQVKALIRAHADLIIAFSAAGMAPNEAIESATRQVLKVVPCLFPPKPGKRVIFSK